MKKFHTIWPMLAVAAGLSCQGDTTLLLRISGGSPSATTLKMRLVTNDGPINDTYTFPEAGGTLTLPGTLLVKLGDNAGPLGVFLWAENAAKVPVAHVRSQACYRISSGTQNAFDLELAATPTAFSPNLVQDCRCRGADDMCAPGGTNNGGSAGSGTGGITGTGGMGGGTASNGGAGGIASDGGVGSDANTMMGGRGVDAATNADTAPGVTNSIFSFDNAGDWISQDTTLASDMAVKNQGTASLRFTAMQITQIRTRPFAASEVSGATKKLAMDVHVAVHPPTNNNIQMSFNCPSAQVFSAYLGYRDFALFKTGWNQLTFELPDNAVTALNAGTATGCELSIRHDGPGTFHYDNMRFVAP